jgi:MFS family permease
MLPASYQLPAAIVLLLAGIVSCFFGYRLFRIVLAVFGFILGALASSSVFGVSDTWPMVIAAIVGGLIGAGLGAVTANLLFAATDQDPHFLVLVFLTVLGSAASMYLQRYFIIVGTSFGGAWTMIVGAMAVAGDRTALAAAAAGDVWVAYPMNPAPGQRWIPVAWIVLGLAGTAVQLGWTGGEKGRVVRRRKKS